MKTIEQIKQEIENLKAELRLAEVNEGKTTLAQEVKKRILEVCPGFNNIDYVLYPIRVISGEKTSGKTKYHTWTNEYVEALINGNHKGLEAIGFSHAAIISKANDLGYKFRYGNKLEKKVK